MSFNFIVECDVFQPDIARSRGYPLHIHHVVTDDGYILELHRMPSSRRSGSRGGGKPVLLQHGMMATDYVWLLNPTNSSLGYLSALIRVPMMARNNLFS